jgi:capsular polysaccharide transport system permease protein
MSQTSLSRSFAIQRRVIGALVMREVITRYGRHNIGFLWLFLEPMMFTLGVTLMWSLLKVTHGGSLSIASFALTGYSSILLWRNCSNRIVQAIAVNHSLLYHRNVRALDVFMARLILEIGGASMSLIVLTIVFSAFGLMELPDDVLTVMVGWGLLAWFSVGLSLLIGAASERSELVERVWHIFTYLMFPLSGAGFMVDWLPKVARDLIYWVPMIHGTEMIRHGYFGNVVHTYEDPLYLAVVNIVLTLFGLALVLDTGRRVEIE